MKLPNEFYKELHEKLAKTYGLTPLQVETIRSFAIGQNKTRGDIAQWCRGKLNNPNKNSYLVVTQNKKPTRSLPQKHYQGILDFVCKGKWEEWKDMIFHSQSM